MNISITQDNQNDNQISKSIRRFFTRLHLIHRPYETQHTFITKQKDCHMDEYILKLIIGYSITDITEKTYTHRAMEQLKK